MEAEHWPWEHCVLAMQLLQRCDHSLTALQDIVLVTDRMPGDSQTDLICAFRLHVTSFYH